MSFVLGLFGPDLGHDLGPDLDLTWDLDLDLSLTIFRFPMRMRMEPAVNHLSPTKKVKFKVVSREEKEDFVYKSV